MSSACVYIECPVTKMILGVSRKDDPTAFGLPGGKVEEGETELQAALRELREETGIELYDQPSPRSGWYPEIFRREGGVTFRAYMTQAYNFHKRPENETGLVRWVTPYQLIQGPFGEYNRQLLRAIGRIGNEPCFERGEDERNEVCLRCKQHIRIHYGRLNRCEPRVECPSCGSDEHYDEECVG